MPIETEKRAFLVYELGLLSLKAALSTRTAGWPVYAATCREHMRSGVKNAFRTELDALVDVYSTARITDQGHIERIAVVADRLSAAHSTSLHQGRFRFGVAQKLVNIHLKYMWVAGLVLEPPHCPIDGIIRNLAGLEYDWTTSDSAAEYEQAIATLRQHAQPRRLAIWELQEFRRREQA